MNWKLHALYALFLSSLLFSGKVLANNWGLCPGTPVTGMIPCDTACFGPAGTNLGVTYTEAELQLQSTFNENTQKWSELNNTAMDYFSKYFERSNTTNVNRTRALDGVSKAVTFALEQYSQVNSRNIDSFIQSYRELHANMRQADLVRENSKNYSSDYSSFTGDYLLRSGKKRAEYLKLQQSKDAINELIKSEVKKVNSNEQGVLLVQASQTADDELSIIDFGSLLLKEHLNEEELTILLKASYIFYLPYTGVDDEQTRLQNAKTSIALNTLFKSLDFVKEDEQSHLLGDNIHQLNFESYVNGANISLPTHTLRQELVFQKSVENTLLHSYLKKVKDKNALKVINHY
ncbi:hypothetical protein [Pseudoalteromonas lipolytica]|uniref:hypothetical protein n=1 Tax=Pseudoalteromonas lipolytica TaxID=570156 RepID=UPI0030955C0F